MSSATYPLRVEGRMDAPLSRWLWLVKWFLAIPHFVVLAVLWPVFVLFTVFAFFAIVATGRYPRALFDFNVGVLRWTWRVSYYSYGANGTDRYPPFTLAEVSDYPAHLDVEYPEHLSRGLALVKWWLLAIPHYIVVGLLAGGAWWAWSDGRGGPGLIGILVLVGVVVLAFTGSYPKGLFDFVLGLNRWVLRVAAYAGLMTDEYPPFRLDAGGDEGHVLTVPPPAPPNAPTGRSGWTAGRVVAVVAGSLMLLTSFAVFVGGAVTLWADRTQRDSSGFLTSSTRTFTTTTYALSTDAVDLRGDAAGWFYPSRVLGDVRVTVRDARVPVFAGIAPAADVERYLASTSHAVVTDWSGPTRYRTVSSGEPASLPSAQTFWVASMTGAGTRSLTWEPEEGSWALVVMNADASPSVTARVRIGLEAPSLGWVAFGLLAASVVLAVPGTVLVAVATSRAGREGS